MTGIRKSFGPVEVLHGVDFTVEPGTVHALIGHNGAGKSTLMKVLGGVFPDYGGGVEIGGASVTLSSPGTALESGVAVIYQDFALIPELDVAHNIALGREPKAPFGLLPHRKLRKRSAEEAERFGISLPLDRPVSSLGVADQQLTEIVRALARNARYLVMDEPTARLAPDERAHLFGIMRSLTAKGVGIVYISHFLDEVIDVADVVTVMRDGEVISSLDVAECTTDSLARLLVDDSEGLIAERAESDQSSRIRPEKALVVAALGVAGRPPVSFDINKGEIVALAGLVGSGRTRLARAIVGDVKSSGHVSVAERPLPRRSPGSSAAAGLLMLPEDRKQNGLVLSSSIRSNLQLTALDRSLTTAGFVRRRRRDRLVDGLMKKFQIKPNRPGTIVGNLSGGNAQKVLLARTVAANPTVLLLDQPTAGVDIGAKAELHRQILDLAVDGCGILLISDDLDEMLELADRVLVLVGGSLVREIGADEIDRATLLTVISTGKVPTP